MRILIVCSGNARNFDFKKHQAFIYDQVEAVKKLDTALEFDYFFIKGKGLTGYLACLRQLIQQLNRHRYHCIHAHVAMSALLANLQRLVPVVTTFHGSDINVPVLRLVSVLVDLLSRRTIYISKGLVERAFYAIRKKQSVIPCGVDVHLFIARSKQQSRLQLGLLSDKKYILFSSGFDVAIKNYPLARKAVDQLQDEAVELLELKNYTREETALLFTAVDVALMTSFSEGSPQFIKEAIACNCPVVSTDVGDVRTVIGEIAGCYMTTYDPTDVARSIQLAFANTQAIQGKTHLARFDNRLIAKQILDVYKQL